ILRRVVASEGGFVVLELDYSHAIRIRSFHDLMSSGANDKGCAVFVKRSLVQGNVFLVALLVCNIDHCNPVPFFGHYFLLPTAIPRPRAKFGPPDALRSVRVSLPLILFDHTTKPKPGLADYNMDSLSTNV